MAAAGLEGLEAAEETETFVQEDVLAVIKEVRVLFSRIFSTVDFSSSFKSHTPCTLRFA